MMTAFEELELNANTETKHLTQILELPDLKPHPVPGSPVLGGNLGLVQGLKVRLRVIAGEATMTVAELMALRQDAILKLDRHVSEPVDIVLDGNVVARGQLVAVDDEFGVRVTEVSRAATP
jgi:flagellar motor switch protein FliN/FliY